MGTSPSLGGKVALLTTDRRGWSRHLAAALAGAGADVALAGSYALEIAASARAVEPRAGGPSPSTRT